MVSRIGIHRQRADPVMEEDEEQLWESGVFGFFIRQMFELWRLFTIVNLFVFGVESSTRICRETDIVFREKNGGKVLTFYGRTSKNVQDGLKQRRVERKVIHQHADPGNTMCVVYAYLNFTYISAVLTNKTNLRL